MFLLFVIPVFLAVAAFSIWLATRSGGFRTAKLIPKRRFLLNGVGFITAITLTLFATWAVPKGANSDWGPFIIQCGIVILGPLFFGTTLLILQLITNFLRPFLVAVAAGALLASVFSPVVVPLASWAFVVIQYGLALNSLCKTAFVETIERVGQAKSVAFLPDSFVEPPVSLPSATLNSSLFVLNQSLVEFIERPATEESGLKGKAKFERVTTNGEKVVMSKNRNENTKFIYEPIEAITAEYIVQPRSLAIQNGEQARLGGARIEIYRREDNKIISRAQYYWSDELNHSCPTETKAGMFVYKFIAGSLNIFNPKGTIAALPH